MEEVRYGRKNKAVVAIARIIPRDPVSVIWRRVNGCPT
jgi:hypothetical protein